MLLNIAWLIPGFPIILSILITLLLLSFNKTMNRLTKPVSYLLIISILFSELINFILFENNISGEEHLLGRDLILVVDRQALIFSEFLGLVFLLIMLISLTKLERKKGYVRYFISLGILSGLVYLFSFSGGLFHNFYDPIISSLGEIVISF